MSKDYPTAMENGLQKKRKEAHTQFTCAVEGFRLGLDLNETQLVKIARIIVTSHERMEESDETLRIIETARNQEHAGIV